GMIDEAAAAGLVIERPAQSVFGVALAVQSRVDFPDFLDAEAIMLRVAIGAELELRNELLRQRAMRAFGDQRIAGVQFHAGGVAGFGLAILADALIAGGDALDRAVLVIEQLGGGKAGENVDA